MYLSLIFLPLIGGLLSNRFTGNKYGPLLSIMNMFITLILTLICFYEVVFAGSAVTINLGSWIKYELIQLDWSFTFDSLTISMFLPVVVISFLVQLYSYSYMNGDAHINRFFFYLSFFTFSMILLITGDNLLILFLGWEAVGVASYLLINFWFTRIAANLASMKAFLINRIGDYGLMLGIILVLSIISDLSLSVLIPLGHLINEDLLFLVIIFLMIGAMAKSAQFGLHSWLASAMEGPTPVSALIHAATMVTAGVYLLMRISPLLELSDLNLIIITWLGSITALFGAASGLLENDIKKVIAFSTSSQLGYMVASCGISQYSLALFHLINHAFFKALLFLSAGAVLHAIMDEQDMRKMGGLINYLPITYVCFIIGSLSLMAFPFLTGFYSKDLILEILFVPNNVTDTMAYLLTLVAAFLTSIYSIRLLIMTFISKPHYNNKLAMYINDPLDFPVLFTFIVLSIGAIFFGFIAHEVFIAGGAELYYNSLFTHPSNIRLYDNSLSNFTVLKLLISMPIIFIICLLPLKNEFKAMRQELNSDSIMEQALKTKPIEVLPIYWSTRVLSHFDIYNHWIMHNSLNHSISLYRYFDKGLLQYFGPFGIFRQLQFISFKIELLYTGFIIHYIILTLLILFMVLSISHIMLLSIIIILYNI